ncbi:hypothetical protein ZOSMA_234G00230 [Zostera marina]|uniref:Uncharacterized protein n=1 Tax=Zostera marina TaxID=29655 RepID=A0A0K9PHY4_ZOSMR|nr:hypothetical protein ZOSMA_234G00230 [Zostera marina]
MIKKIEDELATKITIQDLKYICPNCNRNYSFLDASYLVSSSGQYLSVSCVKLNLLKNGKMKILGINIKSSGKCFKRFRFS